MKSAPHDQFAARLREQRRAAGMTQTELAKKLAGLLGARIDASTITKIEKGDRPVRLDEAVFAARILDVPLTALVSDADPDDVRLTELRRDLEQQRQRASAAEWELGQAQSAMDHIEREIDQLEERRQR